MTEVQVTPPMRSGDMSPEQIIASLSALDRQELLRLLTLPRVDFPLRSHPPVERLPLTAYLETTRRCAKFMRTMVEHRAEDIERARLPRHLEGTKEYYEERLTRPDPVMNGQDTGKATTDFQYGCPCCLKKNPDDGSNPR